MSERDRLIGYLQAKNLVRNNGFFSISDEELNEVLLNLVQFERPDMYAVLDDKVVLLEHFEFDASYSKKKGSMVGKQTEAHLKRERNKLVRNGEIKFEKIEYKKSFDFWQTNFERCFKKHYGKIAEYKENAGRVVELKGKPVLVGFFIEDQYPLYITVKNRLPGICPYVFTMQFADYFNQHPDVDFILYIYYDRIPRIIYLDHRSLKLTGGLVDLYSTDVEYSKLNDNEVEIYGGFIEE